MISRWYFLESRRSLLEVTNCPHHILHHCLWNLLRSNMYTSVRDASTLKGVRKPWIGIWQAVKTRWNQSWDSSIGLDLKLIRRFLRQWSIFHLLQCVVRPLHTSWLAILVILNCGWLCLRLLCQYFQRKCIAVYPPGNEIFRQNKISVFEVGSRTLSILHLWVVKCFYALK